MTMIVQESPRDCDPRRDVMRTPDDVTAMMKLKALGWGATRIARVPPMHYLDKPQPPRSMPTTLPNHGVNSSCRQGVNSGCRWTDHVKLTVTRWKIRILAALGACRRQIQRERGHSPQRAQLCNRHRAGLGAMGLRSWTARAIWGYCRVLFLPREWRCAGLPSRLPPSGRSWEALPLHRNSGPLLGRRLHVLRPASHGPMGRAP